MSNSEMKIGEISKLRFEFRTFRQYFKDQAYLMSRLSAPVPKKAWERKSDEVYKLSVNN